MAYGYPGTFPSYYQPVQQQQNTGIIWVQGEAAAKGYLVAPNTSVALWDSEAQTVYLKSADASGMPSMKVLDYTIREQHQGQNLAQRGAGEPAVYATKDELKAMAEEIAALKEKLGRMEADAL